MAKKKGDEAAKELSRPKPMAKGIDPEEALSSGSTLMNLALTGSIKGAFLPAKFYLIVGDSSSGKTMLTLTCFAEAGMNPRYAKHRLIHDNIEDGALMDMARFFGAKTAAKIEPPRGTRNDPQFSSTVEELYYNIDNAFDDGRPFIYVVDSMDSLDSEDDQDKFDERKAAHEKNKEVKGSYAMSKAKLNSGGLRRVFNRIKETESIIIMISQTRDNVDPMKAKFFPKTRSGGKALTFYNHCEVWLSLGSKIKARARGKEEDVGIYSRIKVQKNRQTGRTVEVEVPIYWSLGIDDIGSCIEFLVERKHWKEKDSLITCPELSAEPLFQSELITLIESNGLQTKLRSIVGSVWRDIQRELTPPRINKYTEGE